MHIPDGFITLPTSLGAAAVATSGVALNVRIAGRKLRERQLPIAGLVAAFIFVIQTLNFPVATGTSGHVIGGALAMMLLGPTLGVIVLTVVIAIQAFIFADGGISALGLNVVNMALVTVFIGWLVFRGLMAIAPKTGPSIVAVTAVAAWASVVAAATCFSGEYALGGVGAIPTSTVLGSMVGVHALIGIGEGLASAAIVAAVLASRPDLVWGARVMGVKRAEVVALQRKPVVAFVVMGGVVAALLLLVVAPHASTSPDGLERVAQKHGIGTLP